MAQGSGSSLVRNLLGAVAAVIVVLMLALLVRLVFEFFGALQVGVFWRELKLYTDYVALPIAIKPIRARQYGGWFNVRVTLSIIAYLVAEYAVTAVRRRV